MSDTPALESLADGRYHLDGVVGEGGFAAVYRATDTVLNVPRAIKVLTPRAAKRKVIRTRLNAEARAMARISHPNVLRVYDIVAEKREDTTIHYVVMDLAEGGTLMDWTRAHGRMPPDLAMRYMVQVLSALAAAHAEGIVHRDVKPQNILLDDRGVALLADFGIALLAEDGDMRATRTGVAMGSFAYMAPEQRIDARSVGPAADIYAVGTSLYYLITGGNPVDLFAAEAGSERWKGIPAELAAIIQCANAYAAEDRFPDARSFAQALLAALDNVGDEPLPSFQPWDPSSFPDPSEHFSSVSRTRNLLEPGSLAPPTAAAVREAVKAATYEATNILMTSVPSVREPTNPAATVAPAGHGPGSTTPALSPDEIRALGPLQRRLVGAPPTFDIALGEPPDSPALVVPNPTVVPAVTEEPDSKPLGMWIATLGIVGVLVVVGVGMMLNGLSGTQPVTDGGTAAAGPETIEPSVEADGVDEQGDEGDEGEPVEVVEVIEAGDANDEPEEGAGVAVGEGADAVAEVGGDVVAEVGGDAVAEVAPEVNAQVGGVASAIAGDWTGSFGGMLYVVVSISGGDESLSGVVTTVVGSTKDPHPVVGRYDPDTRQLVLNDIDKHQTAGRYALTLSVDGRQLSGTHRQSINGHVGSIALSR